MRKLLYTGLVFFIMLNANAQTPSWLPSSGLVAWYPFNGNANDGSGNNYNGTVNSATLTNDRLGNSNAAYSFNGTSGYIQIVDNPLLRLSGTDFTISVWVKNTAMAATNLNAIFSKRTTALSSGYIFGIEGSLLTDPGKVLYQVSGGTDPKATSADTVTLNNWMNIMITYNHSTHYLNIYFDGILNSSTPNIPTPSAIAAADLWIGNDVSGSSYCFNGSIDDIAIYARILSACERYELIHQSAGISITTQPLSQNIVIGDTTIFTVASPDSCLSFQWQRDCGSGYLNLSNGSVFQGVTNDTLTILNTPGALNNCKFRCIVSSCIFCADTSAEAVLNTTAGMENIDNMQGISIYPVPAEESLTVKFLPEIYQYLKIYNSYGQEVQSIDITGLSSYALNLNGYSKGLYLIDLKSDKFDKQLKFMKQ